MSGTVVLFDESMRPPRYLGAAVVMDGSSGHRVEQMVRSHRLPGQTRLHAKNERPARLRRFLAECSNSGLVSVRIYEAKFPAKPARQAIISTLVVDSVKLRAGRLILDSVGSAQDHLDRQEIERSLRVTGGDLSYSHHSPGSYGGLEIADAAAWAYGKGGAWTRWVAPLIESVQHVS
jgi:hypothetical protein